MDNYKELLKIIGVKNTESLDQLLDGMKSKEAEFDHSYEARNARLVAAGHEDGMLIREGDMSWQKIVPLSDNIRKKLSKRDSNSLWRMEMVWLLSKTGMRLVQ